MTTITTNIPVTGNIVRLRQRTWLVEEVIVREGHELNPLVRLACFDDDAQGEVLTVLWGVERNPEVLNDEAWQDLGSQGFDEPQKFSAFLHTMRWNCITSTDPKLYQAPFRAGIRLDPYQLEPLDKALQMPRVNLFIADDVGLGKTIEAGLVLSELMLRRRVKDVVVAAPPNMLIQWQEEMESRFGMRFEILDRNYVDRIRQERGYGVNPWTTFPRFLVSHKLLIDQAYMAPLRDWMGSVRTQSLLILDEAHHAAPASGSKFAIDSEFTKAIRDLAPRFEHRLFLSATPHNGHSNSFSAILEILDPLRFTRGVKPIRELVDQALVRRLKEDMRRLGVEGFPERKVEAQYLDNLPEDQPELALGRMLDQYRTLCSASMKESSRKEQNQFFLLFSNLQQRLFSSVAAFSRTIQVHRRTMAKVWAREAPSTPGLADWKALEALQDPESEASESSWDDRTALEDEVIEAATLQSTPFGSVSSIEAERKLLEAMETIALNAKDKPDARVQWMFRWIDANMRLDGQWNDLRLIVFTEYEDTRRYLLHCLRDRWSEDARNLRIESYTGLTTSEERERIKRDFNSDPKTHPLRILLATDAAREGLNLQSRCHHLIHFDVPWNPGRLEQRNGRIDRKLQNAPQVFCWYFVYTQRPEDRILKVLVEKTETIHRELGSLSQVLEPRMVKLMQNGILRDGIDGLKQALEGVGAGADAKAAQAAAQAELDSDGNLETLRKTLKTLETRLESSRKVVGLDERHLRDSIDCSLQLLNIGGLEPHKGLNGAISYQLPDLARQRGGDPTWETTLTALRPRGEELPREADLLPVVFAPPADNDDNVVQLHLEHKLVKRLLSRFLSQGFLHRDLSRACLVSSRDSVPRVALLGRLSVYGPGAVRLHEQLIAVTARWTPLDKRSDGLKVFGDEGEETTLAQLEESLAPGGSTPHEPVRQACLETIGLDVETLIPALLTRAQAAHGQAKALLAQRGEREAESLIKLLNDQKSRVLKTRDDEDQRQGQILLGFSDEEIRQYKDNRRYWDQWLIDAEQKLKTEPQRIRDFYTSASFRIEPVGVTYLMPGRV